MTLAFLHGEILVGWFSAGALTVLVATAIFVLWFWRPPRTPLVPTVIYLLVAVAGSVPWISHTSDLLWSSLGFALTLPWSALILFAVMSFDVEIPAWLVLPGIALNTVLLYVVAKSMGRYKLNARGAG